MTAVMVFTRDLRVHDNPALAAAAVTGGEVLPLFVADDAVLARSRPHATRLAFLLGALRDLDASLRRRGGALVVRRGEWVTEVVTAARQAGAAEIHISTDVSGYAAARLRRLEQAAAAERIGVVRHPGVTIVPPGAVAPPGKDAYQVFTPYYRRWLAAPRRAAVAAPGRITLPGRVRHGRVPALADLTAARPAAGAPAAGETVGRARLREWAAAALAGYEADRDDLAADRASRLAAHLHLGCLSADEVARAAGGGGPGAGAFVRQLAWRDFFCQLLASRPGAAHADLRDRGDQWHDDPDALAAWQAGQTGYPVVDAAMRQLAAEGYLPNRARMIVASFLTKDLYLDWRAGAAHFMALLADGDVACNQLNWQWVAGTGTDTSRHRVFSPVRQGQRFDPTGDYVRRYVPELVALPSRVIHDPDPGARRACGYPPPLVDHAAAAAAYRAR